MAGQQVLVVGLGRFGSAAARELERLGNEVMAIDRDEATVNEIAPHVTHAVQLDAADEDALRSAGAGEFRHAIVAISGLSEPSIFATLALKRLGVQNVIAKAGSTTHGEILRRVGADRVVFPELELGERLAHTFTVPNVTDYLDVAPEFGIVKLHPPRSIIGRTLGEIDFRGRLGLTVVALRRGRRVIVTPTRDERVEDGDELVVIGEDQKLRELRG